jgi:hypothetical protein
MQFAVPVRMVPWHELAIQKPLGQGAYGALFTHLAGNETCLLAENLQGMCWSLQEVCRSLMAVNVADNHS